MIVLLWKGEKDMAKLTALTTTDNPFDPFTQTDQWRRWDQDSGYYTENYLARIAQTSEDLSELENDLIIQDAMAEIVANNPLGVYTIVTKDE